MSKSRSAVLIFIAAALCALLCAALVFAPAVFHAEEKTPASVTLTPIGEKSDVKPSDAVYSYIFDPNSVYADASGITVSCETKTEKYAAGTFIKTEKQFPSDKLFTVGDADVVLYNGEISLSGTETKLDAQDPIIDFDVHTDASGSILYAVTEAGTITRASVTSLGFDNVTTFTVSGIDGLEIQAVAVAGTAVFVAYDSNALPKYKNAVGAIDFSGDVQDSVELDVVIPQTDAILSVAALEINGTPSLYVLTAFELSVYRMSSGGGIVINDSFSVENSTHRLINISAFNGSESYIYALNSLSGINRISSDLSEFKTVIASASDINGFFNTPSAATVKHSTLYVADTVNGRIAEYGNTLEYFPREYVNPVSVANDSKNTMYVAHNRNTVSLDYTDGTRVDLKLPVEAGAIKQIAVNTDKTLYILTAGGMYLAKNCGDNSVLPVLKKIENTDGYFYFTLSAGQEEIYALSDKIDRLSVAEADDGALSATRVQSFDMPSGTFSVAVDIEKNIFALTHDGLIRRDGKTGAQTSYAFTVGTEDGYAIASGQIVLNAVTNEFIRTEDGDGAEATSEILHANAIIVDSVKHRVFVADGAAINLKLIDENYQPSGGLPESDTTPNLGGNDGANRIIRLALDDTPAFPIPVDMTSDYTIAKGRKVIVPIDQQNTPKEFFMILVDDVASGKLIRRYVYKDALSEPLPYSDPPEGATVATVYHNATPIYKWPSPNSQHVVNSADKDSQLALLQFVITYTDIDGTTRTYTDDYGNKWYRVIVDTDKEGYVLASNVSLLEYEPTAIHPAYNAEIIEYDGVTSATVYKLDDDGNIVPWTEIAALPAGTRVEVIGAFDTSVEYTQIKFFNPELNGSLTCYVRTEHIDYDGVNVVLLIAILVTVVTVILITVIIARVVYLKKKRLVNTVAEEEYE